MVTERDSFTSNPFASINHQLHRLEELILDVKNQTQKDYSLVKYTKKQVAEFYQVDVQSITNWIDARFINAERCGVRGVRISHYEIFNEDNTLKEFKYRRKKA